MTMPMLDRLPGFSSMRELEEWETEWKATPRCFVPTEANEQRNADERLRVKTHIRQEKERLERIALERVNKLNAVKNTAPYSEKLAQEICERISIGELLICICHDDHMPTQRRCNQWLKEHADFAALYKESLNDRLSVFEEEVLYIADDMKNDFKTIVKNGKEQRVVDQEVIMRAKLRIEVRFRHLKAGNPQKWGETSTLITKGGNELDNMSNDELEKKIAELEHKDRVVKDGRAA